MSSSSAWGSPKAEPETRIWLQVVYLEGDPQKHQERREKVGQGKGNANTGGIDGQGADVGNGGPNH